MDRDGEARDRLEEEAGELKQRVEALERELRGGLQAVQGPSQGTAGGTGPGNAEVGAAAGPAGSPVRRSGWGRHWLPLRAGPMAGRQPSARAGLRRRYPDLVTKDPANDHEAVFGDA